MTTEIKDILYNKTAEELTIDDKIYLNKIIKFKENFKNGLMITTLIPILLAAGFMVPFFIFFGDISAMLFIACFEIATIAAGISGVVSSIKESYKDIDLSRKDFKALVKSGRLEKLKEMIKDINFESLTKLGKLAIKLNELESKKFSINNEIDYVQTENRTLIQRMIAENQITQEEADVYIRKINKEKTENQTTTNTIGV
ncbi:MAG: hypothetical protein J6Q15_03000 [Clostridia bacterium]|nr:hypothetical protein [Clostridia bacterium]